MADIVMDTLIIGCDFDSTDAEKGIGKLSKTLSKFKSAATTASEGTKSYTASLSKVSAKVNQVRNLFKKAVDIGGSWFNEAINYVESLNLANVALGKCADSAKKYAERVEDIMGIDSKDWLTYQGSFYQLADGYGIAENASERMSKNLTQLSYDLSSLWNTDTETAFQKLQSGMSGQIKGLKVWGINVSVAQLRETALAHGIDLATSKMTEAQKATLRYVTIMEQTSKVQGDLARTIITPANALRILNAQWVQCQRAMGQVISVIATKFLPYFQALIEIIKEFAQWLAKVFNYDLPDIDLSSVTDGNTASTNDYSDSLDEAAENAEKLKRSILGIDEINALTDNSAISSATELGGGYASDFGLDLGQYDYNFLKDVQMTDLEPFKEKLKDILWYVGLIGVGLLAWKLSSSFLGSLSGLIASLGLMLIIDSIRCTIENGLDTKAIIEAAMGGALIGAAIGFKFGGWPGALGGCVIGIGVALSIVGVTSIFSEGNNVKNIIVTAIGLGLTGAAIGFKFGGWGGAIGGILLGIGVTLIITGIKSVIDKGVNVENVAEIIGGALSSVLGIATIIRLFNKKTSTVIPDTKGASKTIKDVTKGTSNLTSKLSSLAKNLGLGIFVIAEVAVAAGLIVGAIWGLGLMLEQVGIAWKPVIDNAGTVAIAMGVGTGLLVGIGLVTQTLGSVGSSLIANLALGLAMLGILGVSTALFVAEIWAIGWGLDQIRIAWKPVLDNGKTIAIAIGIGTGILVGIGVVTALLGVATAGTAGLLPLAIGLGTALLLELGVATLLFITEIWAIGKGLDKIGIAWDPVLKNGNTISQGIEKGTTLLIGIGVVTAALGVATVASVGLLPLAIALGTGLLVQLGGAVVDFNASLTKVANSLSKKLHPALKKLNNKLPDLSNNMEDFTDYMGFFAGQVVTYSKSSAIAGFASTVDAVIGFFTKDPIKSMADDVNNQYSQASVLNGKLRMANPELSTAIILMKKYYRFLEELEKLTGETNNISLANGMFVNMKKVGENLVTGFVAGIKGKYVYLGVEIKKVFTETFTADLAKSYGETFGKKIGESIVNALKGTNFPKLKGTLSKTTGGSFNLNIKTYATGGFPATGQAFIAREAGPEMVGTIGRKTAVVNNDQIVEGISAGVSDANSEQNALLREQNALLRKLLEKDTVVNTTISTGNLVGGIQRKNRRDGKVVVPVGV